MRKEGGGVQMQDVRRVTARFPGVQHTTCESKCFVRLSEAHSLYLLM